MDRQETQDVDLLRKRFPWREGGKAAETGKERKARSRRHRRIAAGTAFAVIKREGGALGRTWLQFAWIYRRSPGICSIVGGEEGLVGADPGECMPREAARGRKGGKMDIEQFLRGAQGPSAAVYAVLE